MKKIYLLLLSLLFVSCESDPIEAGVVTNIQGMVYDDWNKIPFENLKLKIGEYKSESSGIYRTYHFIQWVDSTYTDPGGYYNMDFETSGQGDYYKISAERVDNIWYHPSPSQRGIDSIGSSNQQDFSFVQLFPVRLVIELNNIDHLPIDMFVQYYHQDLEDITSGNGTVERIFYANKHVQSELVFRRRNAPEENDLYEVIIPASKTTELTTVNLSINNSDFK